MRYNRRLTGRALSGLADCIHSWPLSANTVAWPPGTAPDPRQARAGATPSGYHICTVCTRFTLLSLPSKSRGVKNESRDHSYRLSEPPIAYGGWSISNLCRLVQICRTRTTTTRTSGPRTGWRPSGRPDTLVSCSSHIHAGTAYTVRVEGGLRSFPMT